MKKTKKALASLAIAGMVATMLPFNAFASTTLDRYAGVNRYQTASLIADQVGSPNKVAILTAGMDANLVDALAAAPFAASQKAPILLTSGSELDSYTAAELTKLAVNKVYITTGATVISSAVTDKLTQMNIAYEFVGGANRYETALNLAKKLSAPTGVVVASANDASMVDSLAVASIAAANNMAIVLTDKDGMTADAQAYVKGLNVPTYVIGSDVVVSDDVVEALDATRVGGANRYATNVAVMDEFKAKIDFGKVYAASGNDAHLVDALAGAPLAAQTKSPIVLADKKVSPEVAAFALTKDITSVVALGSLDVVPQSVVNGILTPEATSLEVSSVTALNPLEIQVKFNHAVDEDSAIDVDNYVFTKNLVKYGEDFEPVTDFLVDNEGAVVTDFDDVENTVTFRLDAPLANGDKYSVDVKAGVLNADKSVVVTRYPGDQKTFSDTAAPKLLKAEKKANDFLKLTFDEPVVAAGMTATVDGVLIALDAPSTDIGDYTVLSTAALPDDQKAKGSHSVSVYNATDAIEANPNTASILTSSFTVSNDLQAPSVVEVKQVKDEPRQFDVVFSEAIQLTGTDDDLDLITIKKDGYTMPASGDDSSPGWSILEYRDEDGTVDSDVVDENGKIVADVTVLRIEFGVDDVINMDNPLYADGETSATLKVTLKGYVDEAQFVGAETTKTFTMSKDLGTPKVDSKYDNSIIGNNDVDDAGDGQLVIDFNRDLDYVLAAYITVTDKNGVPRTVETAALDDEDASKVVLTLADIDDREDLEDLAAFTVNFKAGAVRDDVYLVKNAAFATTVLPSNTVTAPVAEAVEDVDFEDHTITITYGVEMGTSASVLSNYTLDNAPLPTGTVISMNGNNDVVTIVLPPSYASVDIQKLLTISKNVLTDDGSAVVASVATKLPYTEMIAFIDNTKPTLVSARYLLDRPADNTTDTIRLVFSEEINFDSHDGDLKVVINGATVTITNFTQVTDETVTDYKKSVDITLDKDYNIGQSATITTVVVGEKNPSMGITDKADVPNKLAEGVSVTASSAATH